MKDTESPPRQRDAWPRRERPPRSDKATIGKLLRVPRAALAAAIGEATTEADRKAGATPSFTLAVLDALHATVLAGWHREESREAHLLRDLAAFLDLADPRARWDERLEAGTLERDADGRYLEKRPSSRGRDRVGRALRVLDRAELVAYRPHRSRRSSPEAWAVIAYGPLLRELAGLSEAPRKLEAAVGKAVPIEGVSTGWPTETVGQLAYRNGGPIPRSSTEEKAPLHAIGETEAGTARAREETVPTTEGQQRKAPTAEGSASETVELLRDAIRDSLPGKHRSRLSSSRPLDRALTGLAVRLPDGLEPAEAIAALELGGQRAAIGRDLPHALDAIRDLPRFLSSELGRLSEAVLEELARERSAGHARKLASAAAVAATYRDLGTEPPAWALEVLADAPELEELPAIASEADRAGGWAPMPTELAQRFRRERPDDLEELAAVAGLEPAEAKGQASATVLELPDPAGLEPAVQLHLPRTVDDLERELRRSARAGTRAEVRRRFLELSAGRGDPAKLAEEWAEAAGGFTIRELSAEEARAAGLERPVAA